VYLYCVCIVLSVLLQSNSLIHNHCAAVFMHMSHNGLVSPCRQLPSHTLLNSSTQPSRPLASAELTMPTGVGLALLWLFWLVKVGGLMQGCGYT
jgi:hypothetical protein